MTKEEKKLALYCLKASSDYHSEVCEECINYPNCDHTIQDDVTETIIKALEQTGGDLINRQSVIDIVEFECGEWKGLAKTIVKEIEQLPSVEKTAEWISKDGIFGVVYCSKCDYELHTNDTNYCPNCGRKMKGENNV